ncbi:hypothetical protein [Streptomyces sp. FH025]|uniref:hypothetical protein n=1 Tax=Streptomyces sp. FH025 TaxID=2815937 RepID=UPI0027DCA81C|nr:hypothetical protein [Streptomyces sp. FH025]
MTLLILIALAVAPGLIYRLGPRLSRAGLTLWVRSRFDPAVHGLPPREQLDAHRAGPPPPADRSEEIRAVAHDAWEGDWRSAAAFADAERQDWDERWSRLEVLRQIADESDAWLDDWLRARPDDGTAVTVHAQVLLHRGWAVRGDGYAHDVPAGRMARFMVQLNAAMEAARKAAELAPEDPGPWVVMVTAARGLGYEHDEFRQLWKELVTRAPYHYEGHCQAMQYWCAKWAGSRRLMMQFAERAARNAPAGSPLAGVYLHALHELTRRSGLSALPSSRAAKDLLESVARSLNQVPGEDQRVHQLRHLLAQYLVKVRRYDAALEQFRLIGPWCGAEPWTKERDPVAAFDLARGIAAMRASQT